MRKRAGVALGAALALATGLVVVAAARASAATGCRHQRDAHLVLAQRGCLHRVDLAGYADDQPDDRRAAHDAARRVGWPGRPRPVGTWTNGGYTLYNKHLGQRRGQPDDLGELVQPLGRDGQPTRTPGVCRASSTSRCCT
ncbi:hypothetical protein [Phytohabitans flavus]|uniref:hypothetical protein n=1 Tax=Phytohabitans flavus TaxID=1076124 RepID=UPI0015653385|nr:hypothetical protein [Phytohabitans flavus]